MSKLDPVSLYEQARLQREMVVAGLMRTVKRTLPIWFLLLLVIPTIVPVIPYRQQLSSEFCFEVGTSGPSILDPCKSGTASLAFAALSAFIDKREDLIGPVFLGMIGEFLFIVVSAVGTIAIARLLRR